MQETLIQIKNEAMSMIVSAEADEIEQIYISFLGKKGKLTNAMKEIPSLPIEERSEIGRLANEIKSTLEEQIKDKRMELKKNRSNPAQEEKTNRKYIPNDNSPVDITMPGNLPPLGSLHLVTQAIREITSIFEKIGFTRVRYPEVEYDWYAFGSLNFPQNHPARDDWETFFVDLPADSKKGNILLTPHTSSGQVREMERVLKNIGARQDGLYAEPGLSIKMLNIAKCYRRQSDVSHTQMFHQFEGLVVGENITIAHLKGVLEYFVKSYFGEKRTFRIRPYHFQFTEPSFEIDISCGVCMGRGCRLCKGGWLEMGGSGMVHPNVLKAGNIDPDKYTGFAFGWGVERVLMMKEGLKIDDLRLLYSNDLEFLEQF
ncbi:MAG: phenylalanine--tRNA ligase subunit alpha [Candidatus Levybacteria bacterium]|nr:phenylalanine--tRNA ligase subunit alpha [Candidatus Levybacteria bacterium]